MYFGWCFQCYPKWWYLLTFLPCATYPSPTSSSVLGSVFNYCRSDGYGDGVVDWVRQLNCPILRAQGFIIALLTCHSTCATFHVDLYMWLCIRFHWSVCLSLCHYHTKYYGFIITLDTWKGKYPRLILLIQNCLGYFWPFVFHFES